MLGFGHLNRCLILADEFKMENFEVHFICQNLEGNLIKNIRKCGFKIHQIQNSNDTITNDFQNSQEKNKIVAFYKESERGIIKGFSSMKT